MKPSKSALEICEEATFLLRYAQASTWACYLMGTVPFVLALLSFWSDMTRGRPTYETLTVESLWLAVTFLWMKTWQSVFALRLRGMLSGRMPSFSKRAVTRIFLSQARWQPVGLIALPVAALLTFPFGWSYAFFQNLTALGHQEDGHVHRTAADQAKLWPLQNHWLLASIAGLFVVVFLNVVILLLLLPQLLISFFGVKEIFHPSAWLALNTTFLALVFVLTHLVIDPFIKAVYVLRCFYGQSLATGEDLRVRLTRESLLRRSETQAVALLALLFCTLTPAFGAERTPPVPAEVLDAHVDNVLKRPEYRWKLPRELDAVEAQGPIAAFFENIVRALGRGIQSFFDWIRDPIEWFRRHLSCNRTGSSNSSFTFGDPRLLLYATLAVTAVVLLLLLWRSQRQRSESASAILAEPSAAILTSLTDDQLSADALPEDEWLKLAEQLVAQGDLRLAIRALFLATLADLARRKLVSLEKFKSNREYARELRRRSAATPERANMFAQLVGAYEEIWYGWHEPSRDLFNDCEGTVRRLKAC